MSAQLRPALFDPGEDVDVATAAFSCDWCLGAAREVDLRLDGRTIVGVGRCGRCSRAVRVLLTPAQCAWLLFANPWLVKNAEGGRLTAAAGRPLIR